MRNLEKYDSEIAKNSLLPLFENVYKFEVERKDALNSRLNFPIAILTLVIGTITLFLKDLPLLNGTCLHIIFYIILAVLLVTLITTFYFFARSILGYKYAYLQPLGTIDNVVKSLKVYNNKAEINKQRDIDLELTIFLIEQYRKSSDINGYLNKKKTAYFRRTIYCLFVTIILLSAETVVFGFVKYNQPTKPQLIEILKQNNTDLVQQIEVVNMPDNPPQFFLIQPKKLCPKAQTVKKQH